MVFIASQQALQGGACLQSLGEAIELGPPAVGSRGAWRGSGPGGLGVLVGARFGIFGGFLGFHRRKVKSKYFEKIQSRKGEMLA